MKIIIVPKNSFAQKRLNFDQCENGDLIELNLDEKTFYRLFENGFFKKINIITNSAIDDFEDEEITSIEQISKILESNLFDKKQYEDGLFNTVSQIKKLFNEALERRTGVYFYF